MEFIRSKILKKDKVQPEDDIFIKGEISLREQRLLDEISTLRKELKCVYDVYNTGIKLRDSDIDDLHDQITKEFEKNDKLYKHNQELWDNIQSYQKNKEKLNKEKEEWIGRTLKFQYLFTQMKKIGLKQSEDIFDCFEDIEVPEVSIHIRDKFIPTAQTDNIDYEEVYEDDDDETITDDDDPEIIGEYIEEMESEINSIDIQIRDWINNTPELLNRTITIQRYMRDFHNRRLNSIITIQRYMRGFHVRRFNKIMKETLINNKYNIRDYTIEIIEKYPEIFKEPFRESFILYLMYTRKIFINSIIIQRIYRGYLARKKL